MSIDLDQALQTYIAEARELLEEMESALLSLESDPDNSELIGAIFRAAHTIKGSAGLFGLQPIVGFTHIVEDSARPDPQSAAHRHLSSDQGFAGEL